MKHIKGIWQSVLILFLLSTIAYSTPKKMSKDKYHVLTAQWDSFYKAELDDRPADMIRILEEIVNQAEKQKLDWDYYDAYQKLVRVKYQTNWKTGRETETPLASYNSPMISAYQLIFSHDLKPYIEKHKDALLATKNEGFYYSTPTIAYYYRDWLYPLIKNDYEFLSWCAYALDKDAASLKDYYKESYPQAHLLEYLEINSKKEPKTSLEAMALKYKDLAISLLPEGKLMDISFSKLQKKGGSSEDYISLRQMCDRYEKKRASYAGQEKLIAETCTKVKSLINQLDGKLIEAEYREDALRIRLQNIDKLKLSIYKRYEGYSKEPSKEAVYTQSLENPYKSYFRRDTIWFNIPKLDDGLYTICLESGKAKTQIEYTRKSLTLSTRLLNDEMSVYVADFKSGKPIDACTIYLYENHASDKPKYTVEYKRPNTYFTLPKEYTKSCSYIEARMVDSDGYHRSSNQVYVYEFSPVSSQLSCNILLDRSVAKPGETLNFKVIAFERDTQVRSCPNLPLRVTLQSPDGSQQELMLQTNEWSSASASFNLGYPKKMGNYTLTVYSDGKYLGAESILMMDSDLLTFDLEWDNAYKSYIPGDKICFKGRLFSYSGQPISSYLCKYTLTRRISYRYEETILQTRPLSLAPDGSFSVEFETDELNGKDQSYMLNVQVTSLSGESREFYDYVSVSSNKYIDLELCNFKEGKINYLEKKIIVDNYIDISIREGNLWYILDTKRDTLLQGELDADKKCRIDINPLTHGCYTLIVKSRRVSKSGKAYESSDSVQFWKIDPESGSLPKNVRLMYYVSDGPEPELVMGSSQDKLWIVAELQGYSSGLMPMGIFELGGKEKLKRVALKDICKDNNFILNLVWVKDKKAGEFTHEFEVTAPDTALPITFSYFKDMLLPASKGRMELQSVPEAEFAVAIYDIAKDIYKQNIWYPISLGLLPLDRIRYDVNGGVEFSSPDYEYALRVRGISYDSDDMIVGKAPIPISLSSANCLPSDNHDESNVSLCIGAGEESSFDGYQKLSVREDFSDNLFWHPALYSDDEGKLQFEFSTSDKLSTYVVRIYGHDKSMNNKVIESKFIVTIPIQISYKAPAQLYVSESSESDSCILSIALSNTCAETVGGKFEASFFNGADYKGTKCIEQNQLRVELAEAQSVSIPLSLPKMGASGDSLGVMLRFVPDNKALAGDAVFFSIPIRPAEQIIKESHSALVGPSDDMSQIEEKLRSEFVNFDPSQTTSQTINIAEMLNQAIPEHITPRSNNAVDLSDALYSTLLAQRIKGADVDLDDKLIEQLEACFNDDGGIAWFAGFRSNALITAMVLERLHEMGSAGYQPTASLESKIVKAVKYLDAKYDDLSLEQYMYVRVLYSQIEFDGGAIDKKSFNQFKKDAKAFLIPTKSRGLNGQILRKTRRALIIKELLASPRLREAWGLGLCQSRLQKSLEKDKCSLEQYAQPHWAGGCYYPNAVLPWRGLLETELYAHIKLCSLMDALGRKDIADGIRLWIMIQKETQHWGTDPAYVESIACVSNASQQVLDTKVLVMSAEGCVPFSNIKATGNDMSISRVWYIWRNGAKETLQDGAELHVGDRISVEYKVWSKENRSFGKLTAPRPSCMVPIKTVSGYHGWGTYRSVFADHTDYWMEVIPEEDLLFFEDYYVTTEGRFVTPAVSVESTYASHYRANDSANRIFCVAKSEN